MILVYSRSVKSPLKPSRSQRPHQGSMHINTNGGLYEDVPKGYMIAAFQDWCYEDGRQSGDTGVIYSSSTGAHIMYFVGYGDTQYWHYACENALRSAAESEWEATMTESAAAEIAGGMKNVG